MIYFESNEDIHEEERISTPAAMSVTEAHSFYSSAEWATKVDSIQTTITLQPSQQYMNPTLIPHLMFSHPLPSQPYQDGNVT